MLIIILEYLTNKNLCLKNIINLIILKIVTTIINIIIIRIITSKILSAISIECYVVV
jgi:hypothetical protein